MIKQTPAKQSSWSEQLKGYRQDKADLYARSLLSAPTPVNFQQILTLPGVVVLMGERGMGKSGTAHAVAYDCHERLHKPVVLHLPPHVSKGFMDRVKKLLPEHVIVTNKMNEWPEGAVVIYDEAAQSAHSRRSQSEQAVDLDNLISISRQRNQLILFLSHFARKLDINIVTDCNQIWWKMPTFAHTLFERDELADFSNRAYDYFDLLRKHKPLRDCTPATIELVKASTLVCDMEQFKFYAFRNRLAPYWSENLSKLFRELEQKQPRAKASDPFKT